MANGEMRAGQNLDLKWYPIIISNDGQVKGYSTTGTVFFCALSTVSGTNKEFRQGLEGKTFNAVLVSTNISKLEGVEFGGKVHYKNSLREIVSAQYDEIKKKVYIALN